jgi:hypothetical protein
VWKNVVQIIGRGTARLGALSKLIRVRRMGKKWSLGRGIFARVERWERSGTQQLMGSKGGHEKWNVETSVMFGWEGRKKH